MISEFMTIQVRIYKTHAPVQLLSGSGDLAGTGSAIKRKVRAIVVTRNPKDACVSFFYHSRNVKPLQYSGPWHDFVQRYTRGDVPYGNFWAWHLGWWRERQRDPERVLWLHYEDMKRDPVREATRVAKFLRLDKVVIVVVVVVTQWQCCC